MNKNITEDEVKEDIETLKKQKIESDIKEQDVKEKSSNLNKSKFKQVEETSKEFEREYKKMENSKKRKWLIPTVIISIIIIIAIFISTIFALININNEKIMSGISIDDIDVSGLTKEETIGKLQVIYQEKLEKEIDIKYNEYESSINPKIIETKYDIEKAVDEAYLIGRKNNIFINNYEILIALIGKRNVSTNLNINEEIAKQTIEDIGTNLPGMVIDSGYFIEGEELTITKGKAGIKIDTDTLLEMVKQRLKDLNSNNEYITIPVIEKEPEPIDIDKIHEEIYKEVKDAYYTKDPFTIYPEVEGVDFNVEEVKSLIASEDKEEYTIKLIITKPKVTVNQIGSEAFPDQLSTFTTRYDPTAADRTTNLRIACQKINGKVIMPGETFSYNQTLGARTAAAGYKNAKVYENGQVVDGIGGGICQISSTLYNSVLMANLEIVERRNHQFVTSYLPAGRDATVVYGMTDFRFKNTRKYPIKLTASIQNGIATVSIFGIKEEQEYTFRFETKTISTIPFETKYIEDASLPVGTEKVQQKGANGIKTETYIIKSLNGKVVSRELLSKDTYDAMQKIVIKGTKGANNTTKTPVSQEQDATKTQENTETTNTSNTTPVTDTTNVTTTNNTVQ